MVVPQVTVQQGLAMTQEQHLPAISSKVMFWRPRYLAESQWLQHIPFYFWLTEVLRPKKVVEPNLNSAVGYFAICQAVDKLNLDTSSFAAFGCNCDLERVNQYNHEHYREFSTFNKLNEQECLLEFDDTSIDLLLLKYDSVLLNSEDNLEQLKSKLSNSAVVLIHGSKQASIRQQCRKLSKQYLSFELTQGQGLMLLCMGDHIPARLEALIEQSKDHAAHRLIQDVYARLGSANDDAWQRLVHERQVTELSHQLQEQTHAIQLIQGVKQQLAENLEQANNDIVQTKRQQQLLDEQLKALGAESQQTKQQRQQLLADKNLLDTEVIQLKQNRLEAADQVKQLQRDIDVRFDELAKLTQMLTEADKALEVLKADNLKLRNKVQQTEQQLQTANAETQQLTQKVDELTGTQTQRSTENIRLKDSLNQVQATSQQLSDENTKLKDELHYANNQLTLVKQEAANGEKQLADQLLKQVTATAEAEKQLNATLQQIESAKQALTTEKQKLKAQLQRTTDNNTMLERDQQVAAESISKLKQSELSLQQSLQQRFDELAILTNMLTEKENSLAAKEAQFEQTVVDLEAKYQAEQLAERQEVHVSTTQLNVTDKLKGKIKTVKQGRVKAKQFLKDIETIKQSELFDEAWYLAQYPEAKKHKHGAAGHYLQFGVEQATNPSAKFDGGWYLQTHQDVKDAGVNPLFHYLKFGHKESRLLKHF